MTKIDFTKPVQTKDGRSVRILCTDRKAATVNKVVGLVSNEDGFESVLYWDLTGNREDGFPSCLDLVNVPEKKTVYQFHVYGKISKSIFVLVYETKIAAEKDYKFYKNRTDFKILSEIQEVTFEVPND